MSEPGFESIVIEWLKKLDAGQGELKEEVVANQAISERTLLQATKTNGRVDALEDTVAYLQGLQHDAEVSNAARQQQRQEVKAAAFGVVRALDNKIVTGIILLLLLAAGWIARGVSW